MSDQLSMFEQTTHDGGTPSTTPVVPGADVPARFDGPDYVPKRDDVRLSGQIKRVYELLLDGRWRTLQEIADATGDPHASISAQLRHLRKCLRHQRKLCGWGL